MDRRPSRRPCTPARRGLPAALVVALATTLLASAAPALAAPTLEIEAPAAGSVTNQRSPQIEGTSSDWVDEVAVTIRSEGSTVASVKAQPQTGGHWAAQTPVELADGPYEAVAEQTELLSGESASSAVSFSVHASKPQVTLDEVTSPTNDSTPSFAGTASEATQVTIHVYRAGAVGGTVLATAHADVSGGEWSSSDAAPSLADGNYTAVAEQESEYGDGPGESQQQTFTVDTQPPAVTLNPIAERSNDTTPSFSGYASETGAVTVLVYRGASLVAEASAAGNGGEWQSESLGASLPEGRYTAVAKQQSTIGNGTGTSNQVEFEVITAPPKVTLNALPSPSGNTTPSFTGTASETGTVTVRVYRGPRAEGSPVASAVAKGTGGGFASGAVSPALESGEYTAVASQPSSVGNEEGASGEITFVIDTSSPAVTLEPIATPSNHTMPTFHGTADEETTVVVHVLNSSAQEVATASGSPSGGKWTSGSLSKALTTGSYTAVATEASSLGNAPGESAPISFVVDTRSPTVTLEQPPAISRNSTPAFSGTASDSGPVTIYVYAGTGTGGKLERKAEAAVTGGSWTGGPVASLTDGTYTAVAEQQSSLGNPAGFSQERTFTINTKAPEVKLNAPPARTGSTAPTFSGTASDTPPVSVYVYAGSSTTGTPVATATASVNAGTWSSGTLSKSLTEGVYTVLAKQESSISGNPTGVSNAATFTVETRSPTVTLKTIKTPSNNTVPTFKGTATDTTPVRVRIYAGESVKGTPIATATAPAPGSEGAWSSGGPSPVLPGGEATYTAVAEQESFVGNPAGVSKAISFRVDTLPPKLTLAAPPSPSNDVAPAFSGTTNVFANTGGQITPIVVHVMLEGVEVARAERSPGSEAWTTPAVAPALSSGEHRFTAYATEASPLGNAEGKSAEVPFVVDTNPPTVGIEPIASPTSELRPTFTGTASETSPVTVRVYRGTTPTGKAVSEATAAVSGGTWNSGPMPELPREAGRFVAVARQKSSLGNEEGKAQTVFTLAPDAPHLHMTQPPEYLGSATPSFSGTSNESGHPVVVTICRLSGPCEWKAQAPGGTSWTTGPAAPALPDGEYEATASQRGATGETDTTEPETFTVDTQPPAITLGSPAGGSTVAAPSVLVSGTRGSAPGDETGVRVQLFSGASTAGQALLQEVQVSPPASAWSATLGGLSAGTYTVRAAQSDRAHNTGFSRAATFTVAGASAGAGGAGPQAAFTWYPAAPHPGEPVTLASTSTDAASPLTEYAWSALGGQFATGSQSRTMSFTGVGGHAVSLRVVDAAGRTSTATQTIPVGYPLLSPFPVVRIVTTRTTGRTRLKVLSVQAPSGTTIEVSCSGKRCPLRSVKRLVPRPKGRAATASPSVAIAAFERSLAPGTTLQIRVFEAGLIGKYTSFAVRHGKLPLRDDACLEATNPKPIGCPT